MAIQKEKQVRFLKQRSAVIFGKGITIKKGDTLHENIEKIDIGENIDVIINNDGNVELKTKKSLIIDDGTLTSDDRSRQTTLKTTDLQIQKHDEQGLADGDPLLDIGEIRQRVDELYVPFEIVDLNVGIGYFNTEIDITEDCDIAIGYSTGKALIHVVVVDGVAQILKGFQVGVELPLAFNCEADANGKHRVKIVNAGNAVDIQMKTLKTKLFGGL